uniref:heat shock 70 kDa protein 1A-like n=1 Tax=Styela clava TaxID=7725 RepID=UPI001939BD00|nr:heat shock 70 kDa protein 1A-like [Styela clava]
MAAIGIDLGTTNSCVAVYRKDQVEIIENNEGNRITPSFVSFTEDDERLVGDAAKQEASTNFENTLFQMKRLIGRTYDDPIVQEDSKLLPFNVIDDSNKPKIEVRLKDGETKVEFKREILSPEDVSAMVLESLKKAAEIKLKPKIVTDAVITVPAYFNDSQRKATLLAGKIAGLNVLRMINEPTAAAIAYNLNREGTEKQDVLIFDLGGGTFDVSIVKINNGKIDVQAVGGDAHLGGDDFDNHMIEHFVAEFNSKNNCDMSQNKIAKQKLRRQCEMAKRMLSSKTSTRLNVDALHDKIDFHSRINRATFEELNKDLFLKITEIINSTLSDAKIKKKDIDHVVLIGGSTRIPKIRGIIKNLFAESKIDMSINPDEAVAYGAAALAAKISPNISFEANKFVLHDVAPLSLGWKDYLDKMVNIVERNTTIPTEKWSRVFTVKDDQTTLLFKIYEGERPFAKDNHFLGSFVLDEIPAALL